MGTTITGVHHAPQTTPTLPQAVKPGAAAQKPAANNAPADTVELSNKAKVLHQQQTGKAPQAALVQEPGKK
jgi:hypothetical protein